MVKNYDKDIMPIGWAKDAYGIKNWISMDRYKAFTKENNVDLINDSIEKINNSIERNSIQKKVREEFGHELSILMKDISSTLAKGGEIKGSQRNTLYSLMKDKSTSDDLIRNLENNYLQYKREFERSK